MDLIRTITDEQMKRNLPPIKTGDTVKVSAKVVEGNRERIQGFEGTVMRLRGGGLGLTITVRRIASGVGVERTFKVHSPRIEKIEIVRHGVSHRAQLYFLRDRVGKRSSLREKRSAVGEILNPVFDQTPTETATEAIGSEPLAEVVAEAPAAEAAVEAPAETPVETPAETAAEVATDAAPAADATEEVAAAADDTEQAKA